jgi:hypothetical protein
MCVAGGFRKSSICLAAGVRSLARVCRVPAAVSSLAEKLRRRPSSRPHSDRADISRGLSINCFGASGSSSLIAEFGPLAQQSMIKKIRDRLMSSALFHERFERSYWYT